MRHLLTCLLLCLFSFNVAFCQSDSSHAVSWSCPENFSLSTLHTSPFTADRILSAFQFDSLVVPFAGNFRFNTSAYDLQLLRNLPNLPLDTHLAVSELRILLGSTREQLIFLDHRQRLAKSLTGDINYHSIVSPGFTLNGLSVHRDFRLALHWKKSWIQSDVSFRYGKVRAEENGGIVDSQSVAGLSKNEFEELRVRASDEVRELRRYHLLWENAVHLLHRDSSPGQLSLMLCAEWFRNGSSYLGVADKDLYQNFFLDTAATRDTAGFQYFAPITGLKYRYAAGSILMEVDAGVKFFRELNWRILDKKSTYHGWSPFVVIKSNWKNLWLDSRLTLMQGDTLNENDLSWQVRLKGVTNSKLISGFFAEVTSSEVSPVLTALYYRSNHFQWTNDFVKEKYASLHAGLMLAENKLTVSSRSLMLENYVWYDENAAPRQTRSAVLVQQFSLSASYQFRKWRVFAVGRYVASEAGFIRFPEWSGFLRVSFADRFFKKALRAEFGTSVYGASSYKGYAFMPATAVLHVQHDVNTAGVPLMDVFVNAGIGKAILSFAYQRFNNLFSETEYFLAPGYPGAPSTLKFSVFWPLVN